VVAQEGRQPPLAFERRADRRISAPAAAAVAAAVAAAGLLGDRRAQPLREQRIERRFDRRRVPPLHVGDVPPLGNFPHRGVGRRRQLAGDQHHARVRRHALEELGKFLGHLADLEAQ
jgi:HEAT repeat protein